MQRWEKKERKIERERDFESFLSSIIDDGFGWISLLKIKSTVAPLIVAKVSTLLLDTIKTDICNYDGSMEGVWFPNEPVGWPNQPPNQPPIITKHQP